jgi:hypothetical protein
MSHHEKELSGIIKHTKLTKIQRQIRVEEKKPDQRSGLLLMKKPHKLGDSRPQTPAIHPRAKHGAFWLFHVIVGIDFEREPWAPGRC